MTDMGLDLDLQDGGRFRTRKGAERNPPHGTALLRLAEVMDFHHPRERGPVSAAVAGPAWLVAPLAGRRGLREAGLLTTRPVFAFRSIQALREGADRGLLHGDGRLESRFALGHELVLGPPIVHLTGEVDIRLFRQLDLLLAIRRAFWLSARLLLRGHEEGRGRVHAFCYNSFFGLGLLFFGVEMG
jgi:hypothetical protein